MQEFSETFWRLCLLNLLSTIASYNAIATINGFFPAKRILPDIYWGGHRLRELILFSQLLNLDYTRNALDGFALT